jgi:prepilin-type N-terminal cleavage/methylation domain-containing protein
MTSHVRFARLRGRQGMTLIELCIVLVILGILLVVAVASLMRARVVANESAAIGILRTITKAQFAYYAECGRGGYALSLSQLGTTRPGRDQSYLAEDIGLVDFPQRNGYRFNVRPAADALPALSDCNGAPTRTTYYASAVPVALGTTGSRAFATSQSNSLWAAAGVVPPTEPFGAPAQMVH